MEIKCPICGGKFPQGLIKKLRLDEETLEMIREEAHSGHLGKLVRLGSIAEKYLKPETLGLESTFRKYLDTMVERHQKLVKELAEAEEEEQIEIIKKYEKEMGEFQKQFEKLQSDQRTTLTRMGEELEAIGKKIVGAGIGKVGELITIKDLQSAFTGDEFTDKRSSGKGSDIISEVRDGRETAGRVVISVKYHEKWSGSFLEQLKKNLREERTQWGMLVTRVFSASALNERAYLNRDGFFIVKPEFVVVAYYGLRQAVIEAFKAARQAKTLETGQQPSLLVPI